LQVQAALGAQGPRYASGWDCLKSVVKHEGPSALFKGLSPALMRQASYSSLRIGFYEPIRNVLAPGTAAKDISFAKKAIAGGTAGAAGIAIANPTELIKVRYAI